MPQGHPDHDPHEDAQRHASPVRAPSRYPDGLPWRRLVRWRRLGRWARALRSRDRRPVGERRWLGVVAPSWGGRRGLRREWPVRLGTLAAPASSELSLVEPEYG